MLFQRELIEKGAKVQEQVEVEKGLLISLLNQETETCNTTIKQMQHELEVVDIPSFPSIHLWTRMKEDR